MYYNYNKGRITVIMKTYGSRSSLNGFYILLPLFVLFCLGIVLSSCTWGPDKPIDLGSFKRVTDLSISHDGSQILFTGCGHKDYERCTIYRFDRNTGKLYRYLYSDNEPASIRGGRYTSNSTRFLFLIIPLAKDGKKLRDSIEIAVVNDDGTGYKQLTHGAGRIKVGPMLNSDERILVYFKGKERKSGRTLASDFDLYKIDLSTGKEIQLTNLSFYGVNSPAFSPDGKNVIFGGDSPLRLPSTDNIDIVRQFHDSYKKRYGENIILQYPLDGSGIDREPVPMFTFGIGSERPVVTEDGSIWFMGRTKGRFIHRCSRLPNGNIVEIPYKDLGGTPTRLPLQNIISFDGKWMLIFYEERKSTGHVLGRSLGMYDTATGERRDLVIPSDAENISIQRDKTAKSQGVF